MPLKKVEKSYIKKLGKNIVSIRKEKGLLQKELADILDIADSSLRRIEHGLTNPTTSTLFNIAEALNVTVSELFSFQFEGNK